MKNYAYVKDTIVRDAKTPVLMMCYHTDVGEKPDLLIPIAGDIWVCEYDEFFDAGLDEGVTILPVSPKSFKGSETVKRDARLAWEYFYNGADSKEYGESMVAFEEEHRRTYFSHLYEAVTGNKMVFKVKEG